MRRVRSLAMLRVRPWEEYSGFAMGLPADCCWGSRSARCSSGTGISTRRRCRWAPLRWLLALMVFALFLRMLVCGVGLGATCMQGTLPAPWFVVLRWVTGLAAPLVMAWMAERTLRIPNTQSATGILYVASVTVFTGELMSQLLSVTTQYPL